MKIVNFIKKVLFKIFKVAIKYCPNCLFKPLLPLFKKISHKHAKAEGYLIRRYLFYLKNNFEKEMLCIKRKKQYISIENFKGNSDAFNVYYMHSVVSLIAYSLYCQKIPVIDFHSQNKEKFQWEWFFEQPYTIIGAPEPQENELTEKSDLTRPPFRIFLYLLNFDSKALDLWHFICKKMVVLNSKTKLHIDNEISSIGGLDDAFGVVVRGTDMVAKKPKGHPIQPNIDEVIKAAKELMHTERSLKTIFVVAEEKKLFDTVANSFKNNIVKINHRMFYDSFNSQKNDYDWITEVKFNRKNDVYLRSIEYFCTLMCLTKCKTFVGSLCGASAFALLFSDYAIKPRIIFKGFYQ